MKVDSKLVNWNDIQNSFKHRNYGTCEDDKYQVKSKYLIKQNSHDRTIKLSRLNNMKDLNQYNLIDNRYKKIKKN
jgi:hypothetical protein